MIIYWCDMCSVMLIGTMDTCNQCGDQMTNIGELNIEKVNNNGTEILWMR